MKDDTRKTIKKVVTVITDILIILAVCFILQRLLMPKYASDIVEGAMIAEYYQEEKDHDVIFLGDCEVYENFSPQVLWDEFGINSYIRGSAQQTIWQSYYLLEDTLRYEIPEVVIFNIQSMQLDKPQKEAYNRMTIDGMKWSSSKLKSISVSKNEKESYLDYVFPILRYHSRWSELSGEDVEYLFDTPKVSHNGYYMRVDVKAAENIPEGKPLADYRFGDIDYEYLDKIVKLCKVNDIKLILIKAPSLYPYWYDQWEEQIENYAQENQLPYINFLEHIEETGLDFNVDTYDGGLHMNLSGAEKITRYLGEILIKETGVRDRRGEEELASIWNEKRIEYEQDKEKQYGKLKSDEAVLASLEAVQEKEAKMAEDTEEKTQEVVEDNRGYIFIYQDVPIGINAEAAPVLERLGEANSYFEAASCAFDGLDRMYTYSSFELDTYPLDEIDYVSTVLFKDDSVATAEGVSIGEPEEKIEEIYGEASEKENEMTVYEKEGMQLCFMVQDGCITAIEYRTMVLDE